MTADEHLPQRHLLAVIAADGAAIAEVAESAGLHVAVPACPGWTQADLVAHVATVHRFWATVVTSRAVERPTIDLVRPAPQTVVAEYRAGLDQMVEVLRTADPGDRVWTWTDDRRVGFVIRRLAHETAVHLADARHAAGQPWAMDAVVASDGIDEFLEHFAARRADGAALVEGSVHLHCSDVAGEWTLRPEGEGFTMQREHAKGDCALRGPASDLLGVLWQRLSLDVVDVVGDADVARRFVAFPRR
jgi:uncharacterized protein (TIGR03083 family)